MGAISTGDLRRNAFRAALAILLAAAVVVAVPSTAHADTPVVTPSLVDPTLNEGGAYSDVVLATFSDSAPGSYTATVDWGDGTVDNCGVDPCTLNDNLDGTGSVIGSHAYVEDGSFTITVTVDDGVSAPSGGTATIDLTVNNVAPVVTAPATDTIDEGQTLTTEITFSDVGTTDTHEARVNYGSGFSTWAAVTSPFNLSNLYDDDFSGTVTVEVRDDELDVGSDTVSVTVNNVAPTVSAPASDSIDEGDTLTTQITFSDPGAGDSHEARVNYGSGFSTWAAVTSPFNLSNLYDDDFSGTVTVEVRDDELDVGSDTVSVTVDNVAPALFIRGDATVEPGTNVGLAGGGGTSFTDDGAGDTHSAMVDWDDGGPAVPAGVNQGAGTITGNYTYTTEAIYTVTVDLDDDDGGTISDTFTVTVANSAFTVNAGGDQTVDEGDTVNVSASYNDTDGAGTHTATINWGDGTIDNCPSDCTITDVAGVGTVTGSHVYADDNPTPYTVTVTVEDETPDVAVDSIDVTVNDVAPSLTLSGNASVNEGSSYTLNIGAITDPGDDTFTEWIVDWGDGTAPQTFFAGGARQHVYADGLDNVTISIDLLDPVEGLFEDVDTLNITVNNVAPTLARSGSGPVDEGGIFTLTIGALSDPGDDTVIGDYTIDWGDGTSTQDVTAAPGAITHTYADGDSSPTIEVSVTDEDGTFVATTLGVTVNNVAPTVAAPATAMITEGDTLGTSISFTDPALTDDVYEARINYGEGAGFGGWASVSSPFDLSNLYEDDGSYTVTIEVRDGDGGTGSDTVDVTVGNAPPVVTARGDANVDEGATVFIGAGGGTSFTDLGVDDTHTATVDWDDGGGSEAATVTGSNGSFDLSGASHVYNTPGVYTVTVEVTDDADAGSVGTDTFTVNVQNTNLTVDADPVGSATVDEGDTVSITADFDDNDGTGSYSATIDWGDGTIDNCSTAACNLSGGAGGTGTVTGSHTYPQDGSFTVTVNVDDGGIDVGAGGFTYTVQNVLPTTNVTGPATSDEGTQIQLLGNPSDPGADSLTYEWTITKDGEFFKSGIFQNINVRPDDNGAYQAQFIAFDDDGQSATDTFNWTVVNVDPTAEIVDDDTGDPVSGIAEIGEEGSTITLGANVDDPSTADTFTYEWTISQPGSDPIVGSNPTISFVSPDDGLFFVSLTVSDDDGGSFSPAAPIISVTNADPIFDNVVTDPTPAVGATVSLGIFFSDPGSLDTHSMTVDWGDGDTDSIGSATSPETLTHSYPTAGARNAEVCIEDDDGGTSCASWWYNVGGSLSTAIDYNGDGRGDLAVGVPGEDDGAGAVHVLYGRPSGLSGNNDQFLRQGTGGVKGSKQAGDAFGSALAHGDFNGDGYTDLAVGAPGDDQGGKADSGNVTVIYGSASGLDLATDEVWHQDRNGVPDSTHAGDGFGESLVAGDFNGDAYADLAVGVPFENVGGKADTGRVIVLFGSPSGLKGPGSQVLDQNIGDIKNSNAPDDHYGAALGAGDFNGDGFVDLAVGVPGQKVDGLLRVGAVNVLFGTPIGLSESGDLFLKRGSGGLAGTGNANDEFGSVLAAGDLTGDGFDDLVAGVPSDGVDGKVDAGTVLVIPGSGSGPSGANDVLFREGSAGIAGKAAKQDRFGASLAVGDSNNDGYDDLLIGIPNQKVNGERQAGTAAYIPGSPTLDGAGDSRWHEDRNTVLGTSEQADHLGTAVALIDVNGNGRADLIMGIPDQNSDTAKKDVGAILLIRGGTKKPVTKNNQYLWQGVDGLSDGQQKFDRFGAAF